MEYKLGDEVKVEFIGKIVEAYFKEGRVLYRVDGGGWLNAFGVSENIITPLEEEKK